MIVHTCAQRSPEWFAARLGKLTGSAAGDLLATVKGGKPSASYAKLVTRLVLERLTGKAVETFQSQAMLDGIEREAAALSAYEAYAGEMVTPYGFLERKDCAAGYSPDGIVGNFEGIVECKAPMAHTHLAFIESGLLPANYRAQCVHGMWVAPGTKWADYFSYNPDFPPALQVKVVRIERNEAEINAYDKRARAMLAEVDAKVAALATMV